MTKEKFSRKRYNLFLDEAQLKSLQALAKKNDRTVSDLIRYSVDKMLGQWHRNGNSTPG